MADMTSMAPGSLTDVPGILVGHATDNQALTGCTVVVCPKGAVAGVSVRGLAPGTRETDLLKPGNLVRRIDAILLTGGSAYGLAAADGVMTSLEAKGVGYQSGPVRVPIVPSAVLFDLGIGDSSRRPDAQMGFAATEAASDTDVAQGNVGAGAGATVGKMLGMAQGMKGGLGSSSLRVGDLIVGAIVAVNALGDIVDDRSGHILAGALRPDGQGFMNSAQLLVTQPMPAQAQSGNTVIGVIATNASLDRAECAIMADAAHDGLARVCRPAHTLYDGDTFFGLSTDTVPASFVQICEMAAQTMALAIINAIWSASDVARVPCARSISDRAYS